MPKIAYNWKRYWCSREGTFDLSDNGYLADPEGKYSRFFVRDVHPYKFEFLAGRRVNY